MAGRTVWAIAVAVTALTPSVASAAVAHTGELKAFGDKYEWADNRNVNSLGIDTPVAGEQPFDMCADPGLPCGYALFHVTTDGPTQIDVEARDTGLHRPDVDICHFTSDKDGTVGDEVGVSETPNADEMISATLDPGWYVLRVAHWSGSQNSYTASHDRRAAPAGPGGRGLLVS